jgi:hypothetical protein
MLEETQWLKLLNNKARYYYVVQPPILLFKSHRDNAAANVAALSVVSVSPLFPKSNGAGTFEHVTFHEGEQKTVANRVDNGNHPFIPKRSF